MTNLTDGALDIDYIRRVGEEVQARLFPRPRPDGRQPFPLPVSLEYQLPNGTSWPILFVPLRSVQVIGEGTADVRPSEVVVVWGALAFAADLTMGQEPTTIDFNDAGDEMDAVYSLLRAVAGVL